jgi:hypothetical protein
VLLIQSSCKQDEAAQARFESAFRRARDPDFRVGAEGWVKSLCYPEDMSHPATYDDLNLVLRLYEMRREDRMRQARKWFAAQYKPKSLQEANEIIPQNSEENAYVRMVTSYWDMVAGFITSGVLNEELFFQSGYELLFCWERVQHLVPEIRSQFGAPLYLNNLEEVARRYAEWMNRQAPGMYEKFAANVRVQTSDAAGT